MVTLNGVVTKGRAWSGRRCTGGRCTGARISGARKPVVRSDLRVCSGAQEPVLGAGRGVRRFSADRGHFLSGVVQVPVGVLDAETAVGLLEHQHGLTAECPVLVLPFRHWHLRQGTAGLPLELAAVGVADEALLLPVVAAGEQISEAGADGFAALAPAAGVGDLLRADDPAVLLVEQECQDAAVAVCQVVAVSDRRAGDRDRSTTCGGGSRRRRRGRSPNSPDAYGGRERRNGFLARSSARAGASRSGHPGTPSCTAR